MITEYIKSLYTERGLINRPTMYLVERVTGFIMVSDLKESDPIAT
jgi:hypothetical protein